MAWTAPATTTTGELIDDAWLNANLRDNLLALSTHTHTGAAGDGDDELSGTDSVTFDDGVAPAAPGASKTVVFTRASILRFRAGAAGAEITVADNAHAADHEPGGSDAMAVDAATGTGSLRTLGTGAQQAAAGNHAAHV